MTRMMTHTCTIQVNTPSQNTINEEVDSWSGGVSSACRFIENAMSRVSSLERTPRMSAAITATYLLILPPGVTIAEGTYRVIDVVTEDETYDGPFTVVEVVNRRNKREIVSIAVGLERTEKS